jgi:hypothetical protein
MKARKGWYKQKKVIFPSLSDSELEMMWFGLTASADNLRNKYDDESIKAQKRIMTLRDKLSKVM